MIQLRGGIALVTGGSRGLGPYIARALAREGMDVVLTARDAAGLEQVAASVRALGVRATTVPADLASAADRERLAREAEAVGAIDVLVNNAGVEAEGPFTALDAATIARTVEVNVTAPIHLARLLLPGMVARRQGHLVHLASLAGKKGAPYDAVYSGTKAALVEWSSGLRPELRGTGVGSSVICPGYVTGEGMFARFGMRPPPLLGSCTPEQVAQAVVRAIRKDEPEIIVNSRPVRPLLSLYQLFPSLGERLLGWLGVTEFQRRKVGG
jgi:short-subunit dehydrogenase